MPNYTIYCDGHSSPHKKNRAGWAILIEKDGVFFAQYTGKLNPNATNNEAELKSLDVALRHALALQTASATFNAKTCNVGHPSGLSVQIRSDSQLAVDIANGRKWSKKPNLEPLCVDVESGLDLLLLKTGGNAGIYWIPREENRAGLLIEKMQKEKLI